MKTTIKDNILHIEIPPPAAALRLRQDPHRRQQQGNQPTEARVDGLPVIVGVNAKIKPDH